MKSSKTKKPAPIVTGDQIEGTNLLRRFQSGHEIAPLYQGPGRIKTVALDLACEQAARAGYSSVEVWGYTYVLISGEWYVWA